uniref:Uncharacterized protein n=1 Tax=uncultured bacterium BLR7 TaxID=506523 RepID=C0INP8_9BACT|nr:hypothetical protein AKSOIL_0092 [uncultured bacterium BLR7]
MRSMSVTRPLILIFCILLTVAGYYALVMDRKPANNAAGNAPMELQE